MKIRFLLIGLAMLTTVSPSFAQAKNKEKAERLMTEMMLEENWTITIAIFARQVVNDTPDFVRYRDIVVDYAEETLGWSRVKDELITLYMANYTDDEMDALRKFYESPVGKKSLMVSSTLSDGISKLVRRRFDADLAMLELRMKNRELDLLAEQTVFLPESSTEKK